MMREFGGWGMGFGPVFMLLFWGAVIVGIVALMYWLVTGASPGRRRREKTAIEIVQDRYARGEIDRQEFERKMQDLERRA